MSSGGAMQRFLDTWVGPAFERPPDPLVAPVGASKAERQARQALRWYSPSWRDTHGEELVSTVLDALPDDPASVSGLSWRTRADLAWAGISQRRRAAVPRKVQRRLRFGTEPLTPEGLAWLRDALDQRGFLLRRLGWFAMFGMWFVSVYARDAFAAGIVQGVAELLVGIALPVMMCLIWAKRSRRYRVVVAGIDVQGWPLRWRPAPPRLTEPLPPAPPRWIVGGLRLALGTAVLGLIAAVTSALMSSPGFVEMVFNRPSSDGTYPGSVRIIPFAVAGVCIVLGVGLGLHSAVRTRQCCALNRADRTRRSAMAMRPDDGRRTLSPQLWMAAVLVVVASGIPIPGAWGLLGMAELTAIPVLVGLLVTVCRIESATGVPVHQDQLVTPWTFHEPRAVQG